ncbi:MAG: TrkH family potassium uptake protein [Chrysiogenales bacterium]|nr:MAG: TrkH family potassium uptake protein [Chrysiogenales bacterium]
MNIRILAKTLSIVLIIISLSMIAPAGIAASHGEYTVLKCFLITILGTLLFCSACLLLLKNTSGGDMSTRDGFMFVSLSWILAALIGSLPFYLSGAIPVFSDAFLETISGFSTTGASILVDIEALPRSLLFWRSMTHWLGGMGIVVLTVAILPILGIGGLQLIKAEAPGPTVDKITPRITQTAKILWLFYIGLSALETLLLMVGGMDLFDALTHTFGTMATGGFSTKNGSVGHYNSPFIDGVITLFMLLAGINFVLYYRILSGRAKMILRDTELRAYLLIFFIATLLLTVNLYGGRYETAGQSFRYASFQAASIMTTTGYATTDFEGWPYFSQIMLFILMFVGGCSGSTGGGMKVIRLVTLMKQSIIEMKYLLHPRGIFTLTLGGKTVKKDIVYAVSGFFFLYILILLIVSFVVASSGEDITTSFSTALATLGNIGPGFGKIGPIKNYAFYPTYVKWFLSATMLVGRLELYTVLILFTPQFWRR